MPRAAEDKTLKGQSYGAEKTQEGLKAAAAVKPVQPEFDFSGAALGGTTEEPEVPEETISAEQMQGLDIPGLGNLGDVLFGDTERPDEPFNTPPSPQTDQEGPVGPSREWLELMHDPSVSSNTRDTIALLSKIGILQPGQ